MNPATCQLNRTNFEPDSKMCYECLKLHDLDFCFFQRSAARRDFNTVWEGGRDLAPHYGNRLGSCLCA